MMSDLFKLTLNENEYGVGVPEGVLADIVETFSQINDYNSWKASLEETYTTNNVLDEDALDAFATKERFFGVQLRDFVLEKYANFKRGQGLAAANAQIQAVIDGIKNSVTTTQ